MIRVEQDGPEFVVTGNTPEFAKAAEAAGGWFDLERNAWSFSESNFTRAEVETLVAQHFGE